MGTAGGRPRGRGSIDVLPSGAYRVRVYAGKQLMLPERVPPGPNAGKEAEKVRTRLLRQVDERRTPRTRATVNQLLDRYLDVVELERSTRRTYEGYIDRHIRPVLGSLPLGRVDGEVLDSFYAQLRRCRLHCNRRQHVERANRTAAQLGVSSSSPQHGAERQGEQAAHLTIWCPASDSLADAAILR